MMDSVGLYALSSVLCGVTLLAYFLGLFDRPIFEDAVFLQPSRRRLWCLLALTNERPGYHQEADRLFQAAKKVLDGTPLANKSSTTTSAASATAATTLLSKAAFLYGGVPDFDPASSAVKCAVYFEEQGGSHSLGKYRWGCGYLISLDSTSQVNSFLASLPVDKSPYPVRVMDLGSGPTRKGHIQWRNRFTPWMARLLHWNREFSTFVGNFEIVECELYVTGAKKKPAFIDYLLLNAKTTTVWDPQDAAVTVAPGKSRRGSWRKNPTSNQRTSLR